MERTILKTLIVEDNLRLQAALETGLAATGAIEVVGAVAISPSNPHQPAGHR
jgi:hypothetical protein